MVGRTNKGLFITTGTFTRDAKDEAERDGTFTIDLIDGEKLIEKIKELGLGVQISMKEDVEVNKSWFDKI
jgi:restriction system protein